MINSSADGTSEVVLLRLTGQLWLLFSSRAATRIKCLALTSDVIEGLSPVSRVLANGRLSRLHYLLQSFLNIKLSKLAIFN